jgi:DNA-binding transcriptional MerR regulator
MTDRLLTQSQVAELLNVSPRTLEAWRRKSYGPKPIRYSARCLRYSERTLLEWLAARQAGGPRSSKALRDENES